MNEDRGGEQGALGRLLDKVLSSEAGGCSSRGLKLGSIPLALGATLGRKQQELPSALAVIARNRTAMAHFCPG